MKRSHFEVSCGVDLVDLSGFRKSLQHGGQEFLHACFVEEEIVECAGRAESLAGKFAAKEALTKALGTGIRGVTLSQIVVEKNGAGKPRLRLIGEALRLSEEQGWVSHDLSITHSDVSACAIVVILRENENHEHPS